MWQHRPRSQHTCLPAGEYDAEIIKVERATSKANNPMAVLELVVFHGDKSFKLRDWIVEPMSLWKAEELAKALGKEAEHQAKRFRLSEQVGQVVRVRVKLEQDPKFGWQSRLEKYLGPACGAQAKVTAEHNYVQYDFSDPSKMPF